MTVREAVSKYYQLKKGAIGTGVRKVYKHEKRLPHCGYKGVYGESVHTVGVLDTEKWEKTDRTNNVGGKEY